METQKKTNTITATQLQREAGTVLRRVGQEGQHLIVKRDGFSVAVIIPIVDYEVLKKEHPPQTNKKVK